MDELPPDTVDLDMPSEADRVDNVVLPIGLSSSSTRPDPDTPAPGTSTEGVTALTSPASELRSHTSCGGEIFARPAPVIDDWLDEIGPGLPNRVQANALVDYSLKMMSWAHGTCHDA